MKWVNLILHAVIWFQAYAVVSLQIIDVHSTIVALRRWDVIEVGDSALGLGNISGWCQKRLGWAWPIMKLPVIVVMLMLAYTTMPTPAQPAVIFSLTYLIGYFNHIVRQNYRNAYEARP